MKQGIAQRSARTGGLAAVVAAAAFVLQGHLPGVSPPRPSTLAPAALTGVLAIVLVAILVLLLALVSALRAPPRRRAPEPPARGVWRPPRPSRRTAIVLGALIFAGVALILVGSWLRVYLDAPVVPPTSAGEQRSGDPAPTPPGDPPPAAPELPDAVLVAGAVLLVLAVIGFVAVSARAWFANRGSVDGQPAPTANSAAPLYPRIRAAEVATAEITAPDRSPRAAIIACYAAMERALAAAPEIAPHASDTAAEVVARAVAYEAFTTRAGADLAALFTEARFSRHAMSEGQREFAAAQLRAVLTDLHRGVGT